MDAARVTFIDSIGVSLLLRLRHHAPVVTVHAASAPVVRTLQLTGVDQLFTMLPAAPA